MDRSTGQTVAHTTDRAESREERISLSDIHHRPHCLRLGVKSQPGTAGKNPSSLPCCANASHPCSTCRSTGVYLQSQVFRPQVRHHHLWRQSCSGQLWLSWVIIHSTFQFFRSLSLSLWHLSQVFHNVTKNALHGIMSFVNGHPSPQFTLGHQARCVQSSTRPSLR